MKKTAWLLIAGASAALSACGSHNSAPVVYGTNPQSSGRVYTSPADYDRYARTASAPAPAASQGGAFEEAPMKPINASITQEELPAAPTYISASTPPRAAQNARTVTVRAGDTVYAIARRTGATPQAIIGENNLRAPYTLAVGQTLRLPNPQEKIVNTVNQPVRQQASAPAQSMRTQTVRSGDTLYSISRSTGVSVQALAQANGLRPPYQLSVGQQLQTPASAGGAVQIQREAAAPSRSQDVAELARTVSYTQPAAAASQSLFSWPVKGAVIGNYGAGSNGRRNDGINIAAPVGTPVRAAADGEVVYRGAELEGYGNLLLIKHDDGFVTAYAHNDVMLVRKGQKVRKGEAIAKVGQTGAASEPQLHFEIRQNLKSVDPLALLDQ